MINQVDVGSGAKMCQDGAGNLDGITMKTVASECTKNAIEKMGKWQMVSWCGKLVPGAIEKKKQNESEKKRIESARDARRRKSKAGVSEWRR